MKNNINEGLIPMNFNFNAVKQQLTHNNKQNDDNDVYFANVSPVSPILVMNDVMRIIDRNITKYSKIGFNDEDSLFLYNTIKSEIKDLLYSKINRIDKFKLLEQAEHFYHLYKDSYKYDVECYNLNINYKSIYYNSDNGIVRFNPFDFYSIVSECLS